MQESSYFIKNGITYTFGYGEGFGSVPSEYKNRIGEAILTGVNSMNIQNIVEQTLPLISIDDYLPMIAELGYEVNQEDIDFAHAILSDMQERDNSDLNYNVSVDLTTLEFQDGTYQIPVTITPLAGDLTPITKTITLVLSGIVNQVGGETTTGGVYTASVTGIKEVIQTISGLPTGTIITKIQISDDNPTGVNALSNTNELKYLIIEVNTLPINAEIYFSIDESKISDPNKVSLYVWETTTSAWTKLATTYLGLVGTEYTYSAITPHFSTFMIGEDTSSETTSRSHGGTIRSTAETTINNQEELINSPLIETPEKKGFFSFLTGAVTGLADFVSSGKGLVTILVMMIVVAGTIVLFVVRKRR
jgi:PGF-pre-PGF domain-containing protein